MDILIVVSKKINLKNKWTNTTNTASHVAHDKKKDEIVKLLLKREADTNVQDGKGDTVLEYAAENGILKLFNYFRTVK